MSKMTATQMKSKLNELTNLYDEFSKEMQTLFNSKTTNKCKDIITSIEEFHLENEDRFLTDAELFDLNENYEILSDLQGHIYNAYQIDIPMIKHQLNDLKKKVK